MCLGGNMTGDFEGSVEEQLGAFDEENPPASKVLNGNRKKTSKLAWTAFGFGIAALVCALVPYSSILAWIPGLAAIVFAIVALAKNSRALLPVLATVAGFVAGPLGLATLLFFAATQTNGFEDASACTELNSQLDPIETTTDIIGSTIIAGALTGTNNSDDLNRQLDVLGIQLDQLNEIKGSSGFNGARSDVVNALLALNRGLKRVVNGGQLSSQEKELLQDKLDEAISQLNLYCR